MTGVQLLDLPQELLDRIYLYLNWPQTIDHIHQQSHIRALSLVSKRMRNTVIPIFFRSVTLCLRWHSGTLVEPGLFSLRRQCPHLVQHIRCVHIRTQEMLTTARHHSLPAFVVPADVEDWLDPATTSWRTDIWDSALYDVHRQRANEGARNLFHEIEENDMLVESTSMRAEVLISQMVGKASEQRQIRVTTDRLPPTDETDLQRNLRNAVVPGVDHGIGMTSVDRVKAKVDALAIVMLCIPPTLNHLILHSLIGSCGRSRQYSISIAVTASILRLFAHRLEILAMPASVRVRHSGRRAGDFGESFMYLIPDELIGTLRVLKTLTLAADTGPAPAPDPSRTPNFRIEELSRWLSATTITDLTVCNLAIRGSQDAHGVELSTFISGFPALQTATLKHLSYNEVRGQPTHTDWLTFLIAIRRASPNVKLNISNLSLTGDRNISLPACALHWMTQALPPNMPIGFERETRLSEDFETFCPLWQAEASERGSAAAKHRAEVDLVDMAMGTRGLQHNVRQDLGEWITMGD